MQEKSLLLLDPEKEMKLKGSTSFQSETKKVDTEERALPLKSGSAVRSSTEKKLWNLSALPGSARIFLSLMLFVAGFCYLTLLGTIWLDTEWNFQVIHEAYSSMGAIELTHHSFQYLLWFFVIFGFSGGLFLLTDYSEKVKTAFSLVVPLLVLSDIGSVWLIQYHEIFTWQLIGSGLLLATAFFSQFILIQISLLLRKRPGAL